MSHLGQLVLENASKFALVAFQIRRPLTIDLKPIRRKNVGLAIYSLIHTLNFSGVDASCAPYISFDRGCPKSIFTPL